MRGCCGAWCAIFWKTRSATASRRSAFLSRKYGAQATLDVVDAGPGVPEAERERVFTPFHRLGDDAQGAGLGLSLVRQIARMHGGDAAVAPRPGATELF